MIVSRVIILWHGRFVWKFAKLHVFTLQVGVIVVNVVFVVGGDVVICKRPHKRGSFEHQNILEEEW